MTHTKLIQHLTEHSHHTSAEHVKAAQHAKKRGDMDYYHDEMTLAFDACEDRFLRDEIQLVAEFNV